MIPMLLRRKCRAKLSRALRRKPGLKPEPDTEPEPEPECGPGTEREPGVIPEPEVRPEPKPGRPTPAPEMELAQPAWPEAQLKMVMILAVYTIAVLAAFIPVSVDLADPSLQRNRP